MSESEKDIYTSNEDEYLTDIFQTEDNGDSGKCKVKNDSGLDRFLDSLWTIFDSFSNSFSTLFLTVLGQFFWNIWKIFDNSDPVYSCAT